MVVITGAGLLSLAVSAMTRSGRYAGLLFFALIFFSELASDILRLVTGNHAWVVISLMSLGDQAGALFFGGPTEFGMHPMGAILMYLLVVGLSILILRRRVQAVEIVT